MPYSKWSEVNSAIKGIKPKVTLGQANVISKWADAMEKSEKPPDVPMAAAIAQFKDLYTKSGDKWKKKKKPKGNLQFISNQVAEVRYETVGDIEYLIAPVIAIREGVLNDELVTAEEIQNHFHSWNGRPIVLGHPQEDGIDISANDPEILHEIGLGHLFNVDLEDGKLKAEMWHPVTVLDQVAPEYKKRLEAGEETEVSTAYYRDRKEQSGLFNDVAYEAVAVNLHPDHLAVLEEALGACSWEDGCGVPRVNESKSRNVIKTILSALGLGKFFSNEESFGEMEQRIAQAWREEYLKKDDMIWPMIKVYDDHVIVDRAPDGAQGFYQYDYEEADDGIVFDEPVEVEVIYQPKTQAKIQQTGGVTSVNREEMLASIVADERLDLTEEQLVDSPEEVLTALVGLLEPNLEGPDTQDVQANQRETPCDQELPLEVMDFMKAVEDRGGLNEVFSLLDGLQHTKDTHKGTLVQALVANATCALSEDQLNGLDVDTLEALQQSLAPVDYTGQGGGPTVNREEVTPLVMPDIFARSDKLEVTA